MDVDVLELNGQLLKRCAVHFCLTENNKSTRSLLKIDKTGQATTRMNRVVRGVTLTGMTRLPLPPILGPIIFFFVKNGIADFTAIWLAYSG